MLTDDQTELVRLLNNPHRINNDLAMFLSMVYQL